MVYGKSEFESQMFFLLLSRTVQGVASSFYFFLVFLLKRFSAAPVIR